MTVEEKGAALCEAMAQMAMALQIGPEDFCNILATIYNVAIDAYVDEFGELPSPAPSLQ